MSVDSAAVWGKDCADAISAVGVSAGTPITPGQLEAVWAAIKTVTISNLGKADVASGNFIDSVSGPVTGVGGPVT